MQGDTEAQYNLALMLAKGQGVEADLQAAFNWFLEAAEGGLGIAQARIAVMYASGDGVAADPIEAHKWFVLAARAGDKSGIANLARSESLLSSGQILEAQRRAGNWKPRLPVKS